MFFIAAYFYQHLSRSSARLWCKESTVYLVNLILYGLIKDVGDETPRLVERVLDFENQKQD